MSSHTVESFTLPGASMGNTRTLTIHRYGDRSHPAKAYLQAGLHADEAPGFLVMHHLMDRLDRADARGAIVGEIVLVPVANPIGVSQWRDDGLQGRFDFWNGINFNRRFPDLADQVAEHVKDTLGDGPEDNIRLIREATGKVLQTLRAEDEAGHLKQNLLTLAYDADIVLDLHCDYQAVLHVYMGESLWPRDRDLPAQLGAQTTLLADDSGVTPFDEACSRIWFQLAARFPQHPIPPACLAATVELRGLANLDHETAGRDADNIMTFLTRRGLIQGEVPELPELPCDLHAPERRGTSQSSRSRCGGLFEKTRRRGRSGRSSGRSDQSPGSRPGCAGSACQGDHRRNGVCPQCRPLCPPGAHPGKNCRKKGIAKSGSRSPDPLMGKALFGAGCG